MTPSDQVRNYAYLNYVLAARAAKSPTVTLVAGPIHNALGFRRKMICVCDALRSQRFMQEYSLGYVSRSGPKQGAASTFTFSLKPLPEPANGSQP